MPILTDQLQAGTDGVPLTVLESREFETWAQGRPEAQVAWLRASGYTGKGLALVPGEGGALAEVLIGVASLDDPWVLGDLAKRLPEGDYQFVVYSFSDRFGESPVGSMLSLNLTWPIVHVPTLTGTIFNGNNLTLSWPTATWADEYHVYKVNGDHKELIYKGTAKTYKVNNLTEETHSFEVTAFSNRFGESVPSNRFETTIVFPVMEIPPVSITLLSENSARISWDFITYANGYNVYEVIDGKPVLVGEKVNNLSYEVKDLSYANHLYYVTSYSNSFGESQPSETVMAKLIIDTEPPETVTNAPSRWVNQTQFITLEATDNEVGVAKTFYSLNDELFSQGNSLIVEQEGVNKISFYSVDKVGNIEQVKTDYVKIDTTAPTTAMNETPVFAHSFTVELTGKDESSGIATTYYSINGSDYVEGTSVVVDTEGLNIISYYSVDMAGNKENLKTDFVKIDQTAPTTETNDIPEYVQSFTVKLTAKDEFSGVAKTYYSINGSDYVEGTSFVILKEGINTIQFYSVDLAGNKEEVKSKQVNMDTIAPVTTSDAPETWATNTVAVNLVAEDENSGVSKTLYSIDGESFIEGTTLDLEQEGIHTISYYSIDKVGNSEDVKTTDVKIDQTAPTVTITMEEEYALNESFSLNYLAEDTLSGIASEQVMINGQSYSNGDQVTLDKPGVYTLVIQVTDNAGLSTLVEKAFSVYIPATLEVLPKVIKGNKGIFTVKVNLPDEYQSIVFDVSTVTLNGVSPVIENQGLRKQAEKGHFKFNREDFEWVTGKVTLELRGYLDNEFLVVAKTTVDAKK